MYSGRSFDPSGPLESRVLSWDDNVSVHSIPYQDSNSQRQVNGDGPLGSLPPIPPPKGITIQRISPLGEIRPYPSEASSSSQVGGGAGFNGTSKPLDGKVQMETDRIQALENELQNS